MGGGGNFKKFLSTLWVKSFLVVYHPKYSKWCSMVLVCWILFSLPPAIECQSMSSFKIMLSFLFLTYLLSMILSSPLYLSLPPSNFTQSSGDILQHCQTVNLLKGGNRSKLASPFHIWDGGIHFWLNVGWPFYWMSSSLYSISINCFFFLQP